MKPSNEHIPFLDYLRGLAILSVFLCHALYDNFAPLLKGAGWTGWLPNFKAPLNELGCIYPMLGTVGVAIFFVVSGFCIHLSHERSRDKDLAIFFLRRFFRIYPPYLVALLIFAFIFPETRLDFSSAHLHSRPHYVFSSIQLVGHLALVHNLSSYTAWSINGVFWTIAVEVQLYLLYPLLLFLAKRLGWIGVLWMTAAIEMSLRGYSISLGPDPVWLSMNPLFFWFSWSIGAALAEAYLKGQTLPFGGGPLLFFPLLVLISSQVKPLTHFTFPLAALSTACVISQWLKNPSLAPSASGRGAFFYTHLRSAGVVSYSFYLLHGPLLSWWGQGLGMVLGSHPQVFVKYLLCLPAWFLILVPSYFYYRFLELPSIAWGKGFIEMRKLRNAAIPVSPVAVKS
jgi:peptidoglycan/LPS O-acetylase OafA/YrhL